MFAGDDIRKSFEENREAVNRLANVGSMKFVNESLSKQANSRSTARFEVRVVYEQQIDVKAERERLTKQIEKLNVMVSGAQAKLGNEAFLAKAPAHVVEGLRKQLEDNQVILDNAAAALDELNKKYPE